MLGIPAAQVLADLEIRGGPEAVEVVGDLDRPVVRTEDMQQDGDPSPRHARRLRPAEELLEPGREHRRPARLVDQSDATSAGERQRLRGTLAQLAGLVPIELALESGIRSIRSTSSSEVLPWQASARISAIRDLVESGQPSSGMLRRRRSTLASHSRDPGILARGVRDRATELLGQQSAGAVGSRVEVTSSFSKRS